MRFSPTGLFALTFTLLVWSPPLSSPLTAQTQSTEDEVWDVVCAYAAAHQAEDLERYLSFFHDDFDGWYYGDSIVTSRADRESGLRHYYGIIDILDYRPERLSVSIYGEIAVVHYTIRLRVRWAGGAEEEWSEFWTDVLRRESGAWRLIHDHGHRLGD